MLKRKLSLGVHSKFNGFFSQVSNIFKNAVGARNMLGLMYVGADVTCRWRHVGRRERGRVRAPPAARCLVPVDNGHFQPNLLPRLEC